MWLFYILNKEGKGILYLMEDDYGMARKSVKLPKPDNAGSNTLNQVSGIMPDESTAFIDKSSAKELWGINDTQ
jgi:hypothetical protein